MLAFNSLQIWFFSCLCLVQLDDAKAISEPRTYDALNATRIRLESTKSKFVSRHKRDDAWNSKDIYLCEEDDEDISFTMTCEKTYVCTMTTSSRIGTKIFKEILHLDSLTDNCTQPFNPFYSTQAGRAANHPNLPFVVAQFEVVELVLSYANFTHLPPYYFCKLTNATSLTIEYNSFEGTKDLGLTSQCSTSECCLCGLQDLLLLRNKLKVVNNFSFCGLLSLKSLDLRWNLISQLELNSFATLHSLQELNLGNNLLQVIPAKIFSPISNLKRLYLIKNLLTEVSLKSLQPLSSLEKLDLYDNNISQLESGCFSSLNSLKELYLSSNHLLHLGDVMCSLENIVVLDLSANHLSNASELEFSSMTNLSKLLLSNNNFTSMPSLIFSEDADLKDLDLSNNKITFIPEFLSLKKVQYINLSKNQISNVTARDRNNLCNITSVHKLDLNYNFIDEIVPDAFDCKGVENGIKILSLTHNRITDISGIFRSNKLQELYLKKNNIEVLSLADLSPSIVVLDVSKNKINNFSGIHPSDAYSKNNTSLRQLNLETNNLTTISNAYLPQTLKQLHLGTNRLVNFTFASLDENTSASIILPKNIEMVNLEFNGFEYLCPMIYMHTSLFIEKMPAFIFSGNPIKCPCEKEYMKVHTQKHAIYRPSSRCFREEPVNKSITHLSQNSVLDTSKLHQTDQFTCPEKIRKSSNPCQCNLHSAYNAKCNIPCPRSCHCFLNSRFDTQIINCTHRNLSDIPNTTSINIAINVYFSNNLLTSIAPFSLRQYSSARELYFEHNMLSTIHPDAFQHVSQVVILNLQSNLLTQLPEGVFQNLTELAELYLSNNRIVFMPAEIFGPLINLGALHLYNNSLKYFPVWKLQDPQVGRLHATLRDNPWSCECSYVNQFRVWLQNFSYQVDDVDKLFCTSEDETVSQIPLISFNSSHCYDLTQTISIFQNVPLWSSFLALLLLLIVVSVLVFIYRAEVQVLVYSRYGLRIFHHQEEVDDNDKLYDAFIAFSSFDEEFVVDHILPGLEQIENPYRVCIHQRDFMVGSIITDSILEAVEKSRRTLIILSDHFVKSGWCRFEFKSAHMKMLTDRCNRVIVIVLDAAPNNLDPEMQLYMKTNTYLKWGDQLFWQKLYFAMPDKKRVLKS